MHPRLTCALPLLLAPASLAQQQVPIANPSFETLSRPLTEGEVTNGCGGAGVSVGTRASFFAIPQFDDTVEVTGWRTRLPPDNNPTATIYAGVLAPPEWSPGQRFLTNPAGEYVASLHHVPVQQTLAVKVRPDTRYRLRFLAGFGVGDTPEGVYIALLAAPDRETPVYIQQDAPILVQSSGLYPPIDSEGELRPYEITATTPSTLSAEFRNKYVAISFIGSDGIPRMNYDDFTLEATDLSPCPADLTGDARVDTNDFFAFLASYQAADHAVDFRYDGVIDTNDFFAFLTRYQDAC